MVGSWRFCGVSSAWALIFNCGANVFIENCSACRGNTIHKCAVAHAARGPIVWIQFCRRDRSIESGMRRYVSCTAQGKCRNLVRNHFINDGLSSHKTDEINWTFVRRFFHPSPIELLAGPQRLRCTGHCARTFWHHSANYLKGREREREKKNSFVRERIICQFVSIELAYSRLHQWESWLSAFDLRYFFASPFDHHFLFGSWNKMEKHAILMHHLSELPSPIIRTFVMVTGQKWLLYYAAPWADHFCFTWFNHQTNVFNSQTYQNHRPNQTSLCEHIA